MKPLDLSKPYEEELAVFLSMHPYRDLCIDGAEYHYLLCGKGETTLVFLVGGMGLSYLYMPYILALESDYQILTFDYPYTLCVKASQGCLCVGDGTTESMCYASDHDYAFRQISMTRVRAEQILKPFIPESVIERLPQELNGRAFAITGNMRRLLNGFDRAGSIDNGLEMMRLECHARELLALCMEQALGIAGDAGLHPDDLAAVRAVRKRIDADAASMPDIAALAKEYAVSPSKLSRDFKQAYGMSIHACVIEARLDEAARLLSSGHMSVGAVAEQVGYAKHSQFSEAFRRRFGVLPKDY